MFTVEEMPGFDEMLDGYLARSMPDHHWFVAETDGAPTGAGYYAPEPFGDRVWNLYFLAVDPNVHGQGVGTAIVEHLIEHLISLGQDVARVLLVETSSTSSYERARTFYSARGFVQEARIREFYGPSDDKIVFWLGLNV
jgi:ribosomal protein S18 acetylase RimI-like enzyme